MGDLKVDILEIYTHGMQGILTGLYVTPITLSRG